MRYHRKLQLIRQLSERIRIIQLHRFQALYSKSFQQKAQKPDSTLEGEQDISEGDIQEGEGGDGFNLMDYIHELPPHLLQQFRNSNPQLPDIFFMTKQQKKKYFEQLDTSFKERLAKIPQRKSKTKKILKFKNDFQIRPFNEHQKVVAISKAKEIYEQYEPDIHFS